MAEHFYSIYKNILITNNSAKIFIKGQYVIDVVKLQATFKSTNSLEDDVKLYLNGSFTFGARYNFKTKDSI